jgi:hypothetical protein
LSPKRRHSTSAGTRWQIASRKRTATACATERQAVNGLERQQVSLETTLVCGTQVVHAMPKHQGTLYESVCDPRRRPMCSTAALGRGRQRTNRVTCSGKSRFQSALSGT